MAADNIPLPMKQEIIQSLLDKCLINSPVYGTLERQLAELLFESNDQQNGILHLINSLAGKYKFEHLKLEDAYELDEINQQEPVLNIDVVKIFNSIPLEYSTVDQFLSDLNSLPTEWTLIHISRVPQVKDILHNVHEHMSGHLDFSLDQARLVVMRSGHQPLQVKLESPDPSHQQKTFFDLVNESIGKLKRETSNRYAREEASEMMKDVSNGLGDLWLREFQCLLPGQLNCPQLLTAIENTLARICESLVTMTTQMKLVLYYLLNGVYLLNEDDVFQLIMRYVNEDELIASVVTQIVMQFKEQYGHSLSCASRYPVILILEDELHRFPWETTRALRSSPVTRVHCFQFLLALIKLHCDKSKLVDGYLTLPRIQGEDLFVILNPSCDIPATQANFTTLLNKKFMKFKQIVGRVPTSSEFLEGLNHSMFIYCGHGNGTIYCRSHTIERARQRAVSFLFGCRSVECTHDGGRVPFSSLVQKYFIGGRAHVIKQPSNP